VGADVPGFRLCSYGAESVLERLGSSRKVNEHLLAVLDKLQVREHFTSAKFPQGLDTRLQRNRLTGGEKRSVANTRAMIGAPSVLLLDEPTAGLDAWKEDVVRLQMIENRPAGQTVVCIAHALSTIREADFILFVGEDGTIKEQGTWDELAAIPDGGFASFVKIQSLDRK
jgi:ATP-binding cassette, subfamily C, bacteriocin exporter